MTVWGVVNAVNVLQTVGFATRPVAPEVNEVPGRVMGSWPSRRLRPGWASSGPGSGCWHLIVGPAVYDLFIGFMLVEDWLAIEFRDPRRPEILIPYLVLFFGSIVLMGAPILRIDKRLAATILRPAAAPSRRSSTATTIADRGVHRHSPGGARGVEPIVKALAGRQDGSSSLPSNTTECP